MVKKIFGDEIGPWTELKLDYIRSYLNAYSNILKSAGFQEYYFIDGFASYGICRCRKTKKMIYGSPLIALSVRPSFTKYFFIELEEKKIIELEDIAKRNFPKANIVPINGDCNVEIDSVLEQIGEYKPFITLFDPQAGDLYLETIQKISQKKKAEILINFPFGMAIRRYMPLTAGKTINKNIQIKLTKIFGNNDWKPIYSERKNGVLSPTIAREKYLNLYLHNLLKSGFKYHAVKNIRNSRGNHIYYLIFVTNHIRGLEKIKDVIMKDEPERDTLFFLQELLSQIYKTFKGKGNLSLKKILEELLSGKHLYRKQDFKDALIKLENEKRLIRINHRKKAKSFQDDELFKII